MVGQRLPQDPDLGGKGPGNATKCVSILAGVAVIRPEGISKPLPSQKKFQSIRLDADGITWYRTAANGQK